MKVKVIAIHEEYKRYVDPTLENPDYKPHPDDMRIVKDVNLFIEGEFSSHYRVFAVDMTTLPPDIKLGDVLKVSFERV